MNDGATDGTGPHEEIARLEHAIEQLTARIENCRKFMLMARILIVAGGALLLWGALGAMRSDPITLLAGIAAAMGGIVVLGSNRSTRNEAPAELAAAEAKRAALIDGVDLRLVGARVTVH